VALRVLTTQAEFAALRADWAALLTRTPTANVFLTFEWLSTWCRYYGAGAQLRLLAAYEGNELRAPLHDIDRDRVLPIKSASVFADIVAKILPECGEVSGCVLTKDDERTYALRCNFYAHTQRLGHLRQELNDRGMFGNFLQIKDIPALQAQM